MENKDYDLIIIGGGPAGLTAAIYAGRYMLKTLVLEKEYYPGGQMLTTSSLENYPGFDKPIAGQELAERMTRQAKLFGAEIVKQTISKVDLTPKLKVIQANKTAYKAKAIIIATGAAPKKLNVPGEREFYGKGVSYCAICDAPLYKNKTVAIVGGGNTALEEALHLTYYATKVYLIHRRDEFRADKWLQKEVFQNKKIAIIWNSVVEEIKFDNPNRRGIILFNKKEKKKEELPVDGLFVFIGSIPNTTLFKDQIDLSEDGFIKTDICMKTNLSGVFAAGDVREKPFRQVITAAADGATATYWAHQYLQNRDKKETKE
jgi:thioredoxin reductase (NADPH)